MARLTIEEKYWVKVQRKGADECWEWTGARRGNGYGFLNTPATSTHTRTTVSAHRFAYAQANGPIPGGLMVDHICHNRGCVNPGHLRLLTNKQNIENHDGRAKANNKLGVRGVCWDKSNQRYTAQVRHNKKTYRRRFSNLEEAAAYVLRLRNSLHTFNDLDRSSHQSPEALADAGAFVMTKEKL